MYDQTEARPVRDGRDPPTGTATRDAPDLNNKTVNASTPVPAGSKSSKVAPKKPKTEPSKPNQKSTLTPSDSSDYELSDDSTDTENDMDNISDSELSASEDDRCNIRKPKVRHRRGDRAARSKRRPLHPRNSGSESDESNDSGISGDEGTRTARKDKINRVVEQVEDLEDRLVDLNLKIAQAAAYQQPPSNQGYAMHSHAHAHARGVPSAYPLDHLPSSSHTQPASRFQEPDLAQSLPPILPPPGGMRAQRSPAPFAARSSVDNVRYARNDRRPSTETPDDGNTKTERNKSGKPKKPTFKRVDWAWDPKQLRFKLRDSVKETKDKEYEGYVFHVRRHIDHQGKYRSTTVDIKSPVLRDTIKEVVGDDRALNLVEEVPRLSPEMLFLYFHEFLRHYKKLKNGKPTAKGKEERKKEQKLQATQAAELKVLLRYLEEDFAETKERLGPMLRDGIITYDLLWALWKPNTLAFTHIHGSGGEPQAFKVTLASHHSSFLDGDFYIIDGTYFEWNGKRFGQGSTTTEIPEWRGTRKINSLPCYPLKYHRNEADIRDRLIERGKKFVSLSGVHYKSYSGIAYQENKRGDVVKFNTQQSRIMIDTASFRRMNPNYSMPRLRIKKRNRAGCGDFSDDEFDDPDMDFGGGCFEEIATIKEVAQVYKDGKSEGSSTKRASTDDDNGDDNDKSDGEVGPELTDEDYLLASPFLFGFSFAEKQWLEFNVSNIKDIVFNEDAWDSLVLETGTKDLIQALVKARKYHASQTIDDVIRGKGKGLVTVLHGPPGTGKTLTAEGISELLKCPLYVVSAGELGTDSRFLEHELQRILDICHTWGAILLLDEADVFLEKRNMQDVHRNALVSIFLRQLEYFQGILFLTTNRVETFDDAFRSRIHIALRYDVLDSKAKKTIFKMFLDRVTAHGKITVDELSDEDYSDLAKHELNGREIKNVVGSAQDLAMNKGQSLSMKHIQQVLDVHSKFRRDLNGGTGFEEAMRSYF